MAKRKINKRMRWLPLVVVGLLAVVMVVFAPRETAPESADLGVLPMESDSLVEGRHFDWIRMDSVLTLLQKLDPAGMKVAASVDKDSLWVRRKRDFPESRFQRIFQNQRSSADFRRLENLPIRMLPGIANGYVAALKEIDDVTYVKIPFEMMAGMISEYGKNEFS